MSPTIAVSIEAGVATLTGSGFRPMRAVCINITGPVPGAPSTFRRYIHPDKEGKLSNAMPECTDAGAYAVKATQVGPGSTLVTVEFTK